MLNSIKAVIEATNRGLPKQPPAGSVPKPPPNVLPAGTPKDPNAGKPIIVGSFGKPTAPAPQPSAAPTTAPAAAPAAKEPEVGEIGAEASAKATAGTTATKTSKKAASNLMADLSKLQGRRVWKGSSRTDAAPTTSAPARTARKGSFGGDIDQPAVERKQAQNKSFVKAVNANDPVSSKAAAYDFNAVRRFGSNNTSKKPAVTVNDPGSMSNHRQLMKAYGKPTTQGRLGKQNVRRVQRSNAAGVATGKTHRGEGDAIDRLAARLGGGATNVVDRVKGIYNRFAQRARGTY